MSTTNGWIKLNILLSKGILSTFLFSYEDKIQVSMTL